MNHKDKRIKNAISDMVGEAYSWRERLEHGGIGSSKMIVDQMSEDFNKLFGQNLDTKFVNIELRPMGIIIYIKNKVNDYAWVIPFYKLTIYQCSKLSIYSEESYLKFDLVVIYPKNKKFLTKLMTLKNRYAVYTSHPEM